MDRNLGAKTNKSGGLKYQFGRKDALSGSGFSYDSSMRKYVSRSFSAVTVSNNNAAYFTSHPLQYQNNTDSWWQACPYSSNVWYEPNYEQFLFDPCPPGWCVPGRNTWSGLVNNTSRRENGVRYFKIGNSMEETVYPDLVALVYRGSGKPELNGDNGGGCVWSNSGSYLFSPNSPRVTSYGYYGIGIAIRCVQK